MNRSRAVYRTTTTLRQVNGLGSNNSARIKKATSAKNAKKFWEETPLFFHRIDQLYMWLDNVFVPALEEAGISRELWTLFRQIEQNSGLTQSDLAHLLGRDKVRLGRELDVLEDKGLVERVASETDRRAKYIYPIYAKKIVGLMQRIDRDAFANTFDDVAYDDLKVFYRVLDHGVQRLRRQRGERGRPMEDV